jgi:hypothetical protein
MEMVPSKRHLPAPTAEESSEPKLRLRSSELFRPMVGPETAIGILAPVHVAELEAEGHLA